MKIEKHPYHWLLIAALPLLVAYFSGNSTTYDVHLHDTYYIVTGRVLLLLTICILFSFWLVYTLTHRFLFSRLLTWMHVIATIALLYVICFWPAIIQADIRTGQLPVRYIDLGSSYFSGGANALRLLFLAILILGQLLYFVNMIIGSYKHFRNS